MIHREEEYDLREQSFYVVLRDDATGKVAAKRACTKRHALIGEKADRTQAAENELLADQAEWKQGFMGDREELRVTMQGDRHGFETDANPNESGTYEIRYSPWLTTDRQVKVEIAIVPTDIDSKFPEDGIFIESHNISPVGTVADVCELIRAFFSEQKPALVAKACEMNTRFGDEVRQVRQAKAGLNDLNRLIRKWTEPCPT